jgi:ABC-2 type transport system permease protein
VHATTSSVETATIDNEAAPDNIPGSRTWHRAFADLRNGFHSRELWSHLGWQDIRQKYRRSVLGPLWITIATGVMVLGLGILYSTLLDMKVEVFLPYLTTGFILWQFILNNVTEGSQTFISNEGVMKHLPAPLTVYVLRTVWRQTLMLGHNLVIYVVIIGIYFWALNEPYTMQKPEQLSPGVSETWMPGISPEILLALPAFALLALNAVWVVIVFGISSTRFRDVPQVVESLVQLAFYLTPIVWSPDILGKSQKLGHTVVQFNPLYHYINIIRAPLIGQRIELLNWVVVGCLTAIGWAVALFALRNYRARVSYWV